jgi:Golgi nucleoside diphosphatase
MKQQQNQNRMGRSAWARLSSVLLAVSVCLNLVQFQWLAFSQQGNFGTPESGCVPRYAIIMDAGSTGSRIHVYEFIMTGVGHIILRDELFEQLKPGLSAFAATPKAGALSLTPLLLSATKRVPRKLQPGTILALGATAGLRMLPGNQVIDASI